MALIRQAHEEYQRSETATKDAKTTDGGKPAPYHQSYSRSGFQSTKLHAIEEEEVRTRFFTLTYLACLNLAGLVGCIQVEMESLSLHEVEEGGGVLGVSIGEVEPSSLRRVLHF